jgi:hypothetical protein
MHQRHDHQTEQHGDQKTDRQIHDRFDHDWSLRTRRGIVNHNATAGRPKASPLPR